MGFHIGDLVRGITDDYAYTNTDMTLGEVTDVKEEENEFGSMVEKIKVKIIEQIRKKHSVGASYWVDAKCFELVEEAERVSYTEPSRSEFDLLFE